MPTNDAYERALRAQQYFSISDTIRTMAAGGIDGRCRDALRAVGGEVVDQHSIRVPIAALQLRDLTAGTAAAGGYLASTDNSAALAALRPVSAIVGNGARVLTGCVGHVLVPRVSATTSGYWLTNEGDPITESQPTLAALTLTPHHAAGLLQYSRMLSLQAPGLEPLIRQDLLGVVGALIDAGAIDGSGASGQPLGVLRASGVGSQSGTSLAWSGILEMRRLVRVAKANEATTIWIADPATAKLLGNRAVISGGTDRTILQDGRIDGRPVIVSTACPASTLMVLDVSQIVIAFWSDAALTLEVDPSTGFKSGLTTVRVMAALDSTIAFPATACAATSVT